MRLVDADALLKRKGCVYDSEGHVLFAVGTGDIVHAPTIDAIPVEWLDDRANDITRAPLYRRYAQMLMDEWQKEQEGNESL